MGEYVHMLCMHTHVRSGSNPDKQAEQLYQVIWERGSTALDKFVDVLEDSDKYQLLGSQLRKDRSGRGSPPDPNCKIHVCSCVYKRMQCMHVLDRVSFEGTRTHK